MGVNEFTGIAEGPRKAKCDLSEFSGLTLAWDISVELHKAISCRDGADEYHSHPRRPIKALCGALDKVVDMCSTHNVGLVAVFDGCQHDVKAATVGDRESDAHKVHTFICICLIKRLHRLTIPLSQMLR